MSKRKEKPSLKWQLAKLAFTCWLVPVVLVLCTLAWYIFDSLSQRARDNLSEQFQVNVQVSAERLDSAVQASRRASYDGILRDYAPGETPWAGIYGGIRAYLVRQYQGDSQFPVVAFWLNEDPKRMSLGLSNSVAGGSYRELTTFWEEDFPAVQAMAAKLDSYVGFYERDGRLYLVRNLKDRQFRDLGVLVLRLNQAYYFDNLKVLPWASAVTMSLNGNTALVIKEGREEEGRGWQPVSEEYQGNGYQLTALARVDVGALLGQSLGYQILLPCLTLLLIPLMIFVFHFFRNKISRPMQSIMDGAAEIEGGNLGYQVTAQADSQEFQYLTDSFNHMSSQLERQVEHIYQEELALRDARIKALQSHINPHFLNNTLEIINWEARMNGAAKVSKMIEALATLLDAAIARDKRAEVRLYEEMDYVSAYFYIIDQRFGKRLNVTVDIPEELMDCMVPRLILQPVLENAVEHGIVPGGCGIINLLGRREGNTLLLDVENNGGMTPEDEANIRELLSSEPDGKREPARNLGISNVNQRLRILYGESSGLSITRVEGDLVRARLTIALKEETD